MAQPRFSDAKDRSIFTIGVTAALLSVPLAAPIVPAGAKSLFQSPGLEERQPLSVRRASRPVAVIDEATGQLVDPKTGAVIDRAEAVLDPATGKLIDPVTGAIIPSDATPGLPAVGQQAPRVTEPRAAAPRKPVPPPRGPSSGSSAVLQPPTGLLAPADAMVVGVVDEVLDASSDGGLLPLASLLGGGNASAGEPGRSSSDSFPSAGGDARAHAAPALNGDARTVGPASGSDAVEVQPGVIPRGASVGGASGVPHLLGAPALSGLHFSRGGFQPQDLEAPQVRAPAGFDPSSMAVDGRAASARRLAAGKVTATPRPGVFAEAPAWLMATASGLLLIVGGTSFAYATRRLRRRAT